MLRGGINALQGHLQNVNKRTLTKMSKHGFPYFTGAETKLCKALLSVQGLPGINGEAQPSEPSCLCVVVTSVRRGQKFKVTKEHIGYLQA